VLSCGGCKCATSSGRSAQSLAWVDQRWFSHADGPGTDGLYRYWHGIMLRSSYHMQVVQYQCPWWSNPLSVPLVVEHPSWALNCGGSHENKLALQKFVSRPYSASLLCSIVPVAEVNTFLHWRLCDAVHARNVRHFLLRSNSVSGNQFR
jgi:hypothetical protein